MAFLGVLLGCMCRAKKENNRPESVRACVTHEQTQHARQRQRRARHALRKQQKEMCGRFILLRLTAHKQTHVVSVRSHTHTLKCAVFMNVMWPINWLKRMRACVCVCVGVSVWVSSRMCLVCLCSPAHIDCKQIFSVLSQSESNERALGKRAPHAVHLYMSGNKSIRNKCVCYIDIHVYIDILYVQSAVQHRVTIIVSSLANTMRWEPKESIIGKRKSVLFHGVFHLYLVLYQEQIWIKCLWLLCF